MKTFTKAMLGAAAAALLTASAVSSIAQDGPPPGFQGGPGGQGRGGPPMDPAMREQMMRQQLAIKPTQEVAFKAFLAATMPPAGGPGGRIGNRRAMQGLTTPQRLDAQLSEMRQNEAELVKRIAATKQLYAVLTPEQRTTLDSMPMAMGPGGRGGPGGPGGGGGRRGRGGPGGPGGFDGPGFQPQ